MRSAIGVESVVDFQRNVFCVLGLPFDAVTMADTVKRVHEAASRRVQCVISTPNTNWVVNCLADDAFRDSAINSDLSIADGMPLIWIARLLDVPIRHTVPGSTLFDVLRRGSERRLSVFFFGGASGAAEMACQRLRMENKGLTCVGFDSAGFDCIEEMSRDEIIQRINTSQADFLVVALGAKKGQQWIERNRARISVPLISHLGAVMNFVAGTVRRAPAWMQTSGLEWLWRIKEEPVLWLRYFRDGLTLLTLVVTRVLPYAWYLRRDRPNAASSAFEARDEQDEYIIELRGGWTQKNLAGLRECYARASRAAKDIRLNLRATTHIDSAFVGLTILLQANQRQLGLAFHIVGAQAPVRRVVRHCCAEYLLVADAVALPVTTVLTAAGPR